MNLPCILGMIFCQPLAPLPDKMIGLELHAHEIPDRVTLSHELLSLDGEAREKQVLEWLKRGFWPKEQSRFHAVQVLEKGHHLIYWVSKDYLRLGNDQASILMPLAWTSVRELLREWKFLVPTAKMVDQIYQQSAQIAWPHAYPPSDAMRSSEYLLAHNAWIEENQAWQLKDHPLKSGHKKDLVLSQRLLEKKTKLAIYGWHNLGNGAAIQPQSLWHGEYYVDYSHGIRLVSPQAILDGKPVSLVEILKDKALAPLISFEGAYDPCEILESVCDKEAIDRNSVEN